jgi:hypothetical protein
VSWNPEPLVTLDAEAFRRELVGDNPGKNTEMLAAPISKAAIKDDAIRFVGVLADMYAGEDPLKIWERIAKGLTTAATGFDSADRKCAACSSRR